MTVAEAKASGQSDAYNKLIAGYSTPISTIPVTGLTTPTPTTPLPVAPIANTSSLKQSSDALMAKAQALIATPEPVVPTPTAGEKLVQDYGFTRPASLESAYNSMQTENADLTAKKTLATQLSNEMVASDKAFRDRVTEIRKNPEGKFGGAIEADVRQAQSAYDNDRANKAIAYNVALGDYTAAKEGVDTLFKLKTQDIQNEYDYKKQIATWLRENETAETKARIDKAEKIADRQHDVDMANLNYDLDVKLKGITSDGGAPKVTSINGVDSIWDGTKFVPVESTGLSQKSQDALNALSTVDSLLNSGQLENVVGINRLNPFNYIPGAKVQYAKNQFNEIRNLLSLENRSKLKGQGAVSDFEGKMLASASSALSASLSNEDAKKELAKVRGAFANAAGLPSTVKITDPSTGKSVIVSATRDTINKALIDGATVEYK